MRHVLADHPELSIFGASTSRVRDGLSRAGSTLLLATGAAVLLLTGCSAPMEVRADNSAPRNSAPPAVYKIGPQDVLDISVFNLPELNRTVQVSDAGAFNFPLIGDVSTSGLSAHEVETEVAKRLNAKYVRSPQVTVLVKEFNSQHVTVDGAVKKPGVFPVRGANTLMQAIALAGGLDTDVSASSVSVFRQDASGATTLHYDIDAIRAGQMEDPQIFNGDSVIVDSSEGKTVMNNIGKVSPVFNLLRVVP